MNTYSAFPSCLDPQDTSSSSTTTTTLNSSGAVAADRANFAKTPQSQLARQSTTLLQNCRKGKGGSPALVTVSNNYSAFIEAVFSPAKYALFQICGSWFLRVCCGAGGGVPWLRLATTAVAAKVGCVGGTVLTIVYLILLLGRSADDDGSPEGRRDSDGDGDGDGDGRSVDAGRSLKILFDEVFYSALASAIGSSLYLMTASSSSSSSSSSAAAAYLDVRMHMLAGMIGPLVFLSVMFGAVGALWCTMRTYSRFMDWYSGYS